MCRSRGWGVSILNGLVMNEMNISKYLKIWPRDEEVVITLELNQVQLPEEE